MATSSNWVRAHVRGTRDPRDRRGDRALGRDRVSGVGSALAHCTSVDVVRFVKGDDVGPDAVTQRPLDLESVLADFGPALSRICYLYAFTAADRDDLFQEISIALWQALPRFRGEASIRTFVLRVAHNRGLSFRARRRLGVVSDQSPDALETPHPSAHEQLERSEARERLMRALTSLPPLQRQALSLQLEGLSTEEMCAVLGISANALGVRLHRARHSLRTLLKDEEGR